MTDEELQTAIQAIQQAELDFALDDELDTEEEAGSIALFLEDHYLRPPASAQQIAECERFIGRPFSPSYRHFLRLHDGWQGFYESAGIGYLFGTYHYRFDETARERFAISVQADMMWGMWQYESETAQGDGHGIVTVKSEPAPIPDYPNPLYYPENFYPFVDGKHPESDELKAAREAINAFDEAKGSFPTWKHTLIGSEAHSRLVLDIDTLRADGEMDVVESIDGRETRWSNFYEFLKDKVTDRDV